MNREQAKKLLPIIQAWVEGKDIECKSYLNPNPHWFPIMAHDQHEFSNNWEYRIKPEVKEKWIVIHRNGSVSHYEQKQKLLFSDLFVAQVKITYTEGEGL